MIRVLNFFCVALMGLSILALYNVSERTRLAGVDLHKANQQIVQERSQISVLETEWEGVASPAKIAILRKQARPRQHRDRAAFLARTPAAPRRRQCAAQRFAGPPRERAGAAAIRCDPADRRAQRNAMT